VSLYSTVHNTVVFVRACETCDTNMLVGVQWVEGDVCELTVHFFNPLPFDVEVANFVRSHVNFLLFYIFSICCLQLAKHLSWLNKMSFILTFYVYICSF